MPPDQHPAEESGRSPRSHEAHKTTKSGTCFRRLYYDAVMAPDINVVIVTYNSAHVIGDLLDSLPAALGGLTADVVVVDNGSTDGTCELLSKRSGSRLVCSVNAGYAAGINLGIHESETAEAILILNPDVRLYEDSVPLLMEALADPQVGIVAPQVRSPEGRLELSLRREPTLPRALGLTRTGLPLLSEFVTESESYASPCDVDWALGAVLLMSRKCYEVIEGWDESYFLYSEETDASLRARDFGLATRYEPRAVAVHIGGQSGRNDQTHTMQIINRVRLYRRRHRAFASFCYFALAAARELSWIAHGHKESRTALAALLRPSRRPAELKANDRFIPS
jgi:N-acetylglucosaminyl-diphospho-decaprenol L-rhamnosyltransferase